MTPPAHPERYKNHRFPAEIISHGVWLYYRFTLSYRDVQELLYERGIDVTYEAIRQWCLKFGQGIVKLTVERKKTFDSVGISCVKPKITRPVSMLEGLMRYSPAMLGIGPQRPRVSNRPGYHVGVRDWVLLQEWLVI
jgi:hypothetical protein